MSCKRFGPAIAAYAAGAALDPAAERHLSGCAACRQLLDTQAQLLAELDAELGRSLSITASPDFTAKVARSARDAAAAPAHRWIPAPVWVGLATAAAIALAVWVGQPSVDNPPRPADVEPVTIGAGGPPMEAAAGAPPIGSGRGDSGAIGTRTARSFSRSSRSSRG